MHSLIHGHALIQIGIQQARGANARQAAPGRCKAEAALHQPVHAQLCLAAAQALIHHRIPRDPLAGFLAALAIRHAHNAHAVGDFFSMTNCHIAARRVGQHGHAAHVQAQHLGHIAQQRFGGGVQRYRAHRFPRSADNSASPPWPG